MRRGFHLLGKFSGLLVMALLAASGCSVIDTGDADLLDTATRRLPSTATATDDLVDSFVLEIQEDGRDPVAKRVPLEGALFVQEALEKSGAARRFRRMEIRLHRPLRGGGTHKLEIPFDSRQGHVPGVFDYAIRPGDRLIVREDSSTMWDDMLRELGEFF